MKEEIAFCGSRYTKPGDIVVHVGDLSLTIRDKVRRDTVESRSEKAFEDAIAGP